ncbi:hypothetical protein CFP56_002555 [Quercus suber]|uniref:Uncharacterized protein n=1 Tax=Quercus suber TaxID=58331 RepID=A0AAW0LH48_QUESU
MLSLLTLKNGGGGGGGGGSGVRGNMLIAMHKTRHIEFSSSSDLYLQLIMSFLCSMLCSCNESEAEGSRMKI